MFGRSTIHSIYPYLLLLLVPTLFIIFFCSLFFLFFLSLVAFFFFLLRAACSCCVALMTMNAAMAVGMHVFMCVTRNGYLTALDYL